MKRFLLAALFVIALFSMLCIGFALGTVFSPALRRVTQSIEQRLFSSKAVPNQTPNFNLPLPRENFLNPKQGVVVLDVTAGSPAAKAGLEPGDIILSMNGKTIEQPSDAIDLIAGLKPGNSVSIEVLRAGEAKREITVQLGENPEKEGAGWLGIQIGPPTAIFDLPQGEDGRQQPWFPHNFGQDVLHPGVMINEVVPGSPAEQAGLKVGQLIQSVDGVKLDASHNLAEIVAAHKPGDTIKLTVIGPGARNFQTHDVLVTLGENPDKAGSTWLGIRYSIIDMDIERKFFPEG